MPAFDQVELRTERLLLRPLRGADAPALFRLFSDLRTTRYLSRPAWASIELAQERIARDVEAMSAGKSLTLALERLGTPRLIGECTLFNFSAQCRRAEVGYALDADFRGRGYMHEALAALLRYGFEQLQLNRVEADIDPRNAPSARCLERLGFVREGLLRERWIVDGEVSDSSLYGLLSRDWSSAVRA